MSRKELNKEERKKFEEYREEFNKLFWGSPNASIYDWLLDIHFTTHDLKQQICDLKLLILELQKNDT